MRSLIAGVLMTLAAAGPAAAGSTTWEGPDPNNAPWVNPDPVAPDQQDPTIEGNAIVQNDGSSEGGITAYFRWVRVNPETSEEEVMVTAGSAAPGATVDSEDHRPQGTGWQLVQVRVRANDVSKNVRGTCVWT